MSTLVSLRNLTKTYQRGPEKIEVLHGVDLDIDKGDFIALMGPSGSGKTTLLNLIGGLDSPSSGQIDIAGSRIDQMNSGQLAAWRSNNVGFVFQFYNLMQAQCGDCPATGRTGGSRTASSIRIVRWTAATRRDRARHRFRSDLPDLRRTDG
jgi:ABC-type phosphate/phosphonate transport system ATPase subunit